MIIHIEVTMDDGRKLEVSKVAAESLFAAEIDAVKDIIVMQVAHQRAWKRVEPCQT